MAFEIDKIASLQIGVQGENIARSIPIDMTKWVEELNADGIEGYQFHVLFQPYNDPNVYPMVSTYDAEARVLTWKITAEATLTPGVGYAEVRAQEETSGLVKKTRIIPTSVEKSVSGIESDPPEVQEAWVTIVLNARTAAEAAALEAEEWATNAKKIIIISDTQPVNEPYNKLWIKDQAEVEYTVPLYSEFEALAGEVDGKYEKPVGGIPASDLALGVIPDVSGFYTKPAGGIPASDIASGVIPDISGKADAPSGTKAAGKVYGLDSSLNPAWIEQSGGGGGDPTEIIDDTAGAGDTDKVWSADKTAGEVSDLLSAIDDKQDAPSTAGTAGQVLSLDSNLDPVWTTPSGGGVSDVQVNGTSVVSQGIANVPVANSSTFGAVKVGANGITLNSSNVLTPQIAIESDIKTGTTTSRLQIPANQHIAAFYGLAKASGDSTQSASSNAVGTYTETAKSAISDMLNAPETVSGTTPSITAKPGVRYICGECSTLTITAPASGCVDITFTSGSTPTVLSVSSAKTGVTAIKWANGFDPTSLDANTTYEINILDGEFGVVGSWT